jgi:hypothetical protein
LRNISKDFLQGAAAGEGAPAAGTDHYTSDISSVVRTVIENFDSVDDVFACFYAAHEFR